MQRGQPEIRRSLQLAARTALASTSTMLNVPELGKPWIQTVDIIYPHTVKKDKSSPQQNNAMMV